MTFDATTIGNLVLGYLFLGALTWAIAKTSGSLDAMRARHPDKRHEAFVLMQLSIFLKWPYAVVALVFNAVRRARR